METIVVYFQNLWAEWLLPVIQLVVGLGLVIFVHELGHFLIAKAVGIKVDRFALGFGPRLLGFQKGETDYCVNLLPLGGYVKMLGQEDFKPLEGSEADPRAYGNKPVWARLAVISAGVVMNVIFAAVLFVVVCLVGISLPAPVVGHVVPDYPAATAQINWHDASSPRPNGAGTNPPGTKGLEPGDRILKIDGEGLLLKIIGTDIARFAKLAVVAALAEADDVFTMTVERRLDGRLWTGTAKIGVVPLPTRRGRQLAFGIAPANDTVFDKLHKYTANDPFREGDKILTINGRELNHAWDLPAIARTFDGSPVTVTVLRDGRKSDLQVQPTLAGGNCDDVLYMPDGSQMPRLYGTVLSQDSKEVLIKTEDGQERRFPRTKVSLGKDELLDVLGMIPRLKVMGVSDSSPSDKAGLQPGDIIVGYGDRQTPSLRELFEINERFAETGTNIVVLRGGRMLQPMWIVPTKHNDRILVGMMPGVDLMNTVVAGVRPNSPAAKAGINPGDRIEKINNRQVGTWIDVVNALKDSQGRDVSITYRRGVRQLTASAGELDETVFDPKTYQYITLPGPRSLKPLEIAVVKTNPLSAVAWGARETRDMIVTTYATLRGLMRGSVSPKQLSGPVGIGSMAIKVGRTKLVKLLYLMAIISVSLAVVNFLPIPVLDGGHAVFLLIEKVRRKPVPVKILNIAQMVGLALILFVFVALTWNDLLRGWKGLW